MDPYESEYQRLQSIREYLYQPVNPNQNALPYHRIGHLQVTSGHADHCQFRVQGKQAPCSCCYGSFTFSNANNFIETLFIQPAAELRSKVVSTIAKIPESAGSDHSFGAKLWSRLVSEPGTAWTVGTATCSSAPMASSDALGIGHQGSVRPCR